MVMSIRGRSTHGAQAQTPVQHLLNPLLAHAYSMHEPAQDMHSTIVVYQFDSCYIVAVTTGTQGAPPLDMLMTGGLDGSAKGSAEAAGGAAVAACRSGVLTAPPPRPAADRGEAVAWLTRATRITCFSVETTSGGRMLGAPWKTTGNSSGQSLGGIWHSMEDGIPGKCRSQQA